MSRLAVFFLALAAAALADHDPSGTLVLQLVAGQSAPVSALPGSNVLCDDLSVVSPEFSDGGEGFLLRGLQPGTTLCGIWFAGEKPGGLYRVIVVPGGDGLDGGPSTKPPPTDAGGTGAPDGGTSDGASPDSSTIAPEPRG